MTTYVCSLSNCLSNLTNEYFGSFFSFMEMLLGKLHLTFA